jgi:cadmium resistance transport/sequestration family protein
MADIISLLGIGAAAFAATDIDDMFVLMAFFATRRYFTPHIVFGQFLGIGTLIAISLAGSLVALVIPRNFLGLMGLLPIALGIKELLELRKGEEDDDEEPKPRFQTKAAYLSFLGVAMVTIANGGDNIGIYTPLFAINNEISQLVMFVFIFLALTAVWCGLAYYLVNHSFLAGQIRRIGRFILPFVLIGLGIFIMGEAFL